MKRIKKVIAIIVSLTVVLLCPVGTLALNFNGTASAGGDGSSTTASTGGYAVPDMIVNNSNRAVGYRFTLIDGAGNSISSVIDVFRYSTYTADGRFYAGYYKFDAKYPKTFLKNNYWTMSFSTSGTTASVCHDSDMGLTLPNDTTGLPGWCTDYNMGTIIQRLWGTNITTMRYNAWAILIEPIFPVKLGGTYHALTVTEIAVYGASKFGAGSNGGSSKNSNSWGFISNYTNRYLPNSLRLTTGYCGMTAAGYLGGRTTFSNIIANGYGAAIAYSDSLDQAPGIVRSTYYQNSYDGFYVYVKTERAASLKIPTWTEHNGQDELIWYDATSQYSNIRGEDYNWILYVPRSEHNYEIGVYITHFYAYSAAGKLTTGGNAYEPPKVNAVTVRQTDSGGFNVYSQTAAANNLSLPVWTENGGQDDLKWHQAYQENNTVDGVNYNWRTYIPLSDHNNEMGKYIIHFYVANACSEGLYATQTTFTPQAQAQLQVRYCEAWQGNVDDRTVKKYGTSTGMKFSDYTYENGYPKLSEKVWFVVRFVPEQVNCRVRQTVWLEDGAVVSRDVMLNDNQLYSASLNPETIDENRQCYIVKARVDLLKSDGTVDREGDVFTFYIPVCPTIHYTVSAYSITGDLQAKTGENGSSGSVYYGQRIYPEYTFTSDNTWVSEYDFSNTLSEWNGFQWVSAYTEDKDMNVKNTEISKATQYAAESKLGLYTVPDNSGFNKNIMLFDTTQGWSKDYIHTRYTDQSEIPILKSDVELALIQLTDNDGNVVDSTRLEAGQELKILYYYRNNTDCTVYVNGFGNNRNQLDGIFAIPARQEICVDGGSFTVPNDRAFSVWGGVYLEGAGIYNTDYELYGNNNDFTLECTVNHPLRLAAIEQNADYREKTDVVTSFWVINASNTDFTPDDNISLRLVILNSQGKQILLKTVQNVIVPAKDKNICYCKWRVPSGLNSGKVIIQAMIVENGNYYNSISGQYTTIPYTVYNTPDTQYEKSAPEGFTASPVPVTEQHYAAWWEYIYSGGQFEKVNYGIGIYTKNIHKIEPAAGNSAAKNGNVWSMKSGYGISLQSCCCCIGVTGYANPTAISYTTPQYAYALFPEYNYRYSPYTYQTLTSKVINGYRYWGFPETADYGALHFIPVWYPDGKYTVSVVETDCWTPAGMITTTNVPTTVNISGNMYSDRYVGR